MTGPVPMQGSAPARAVRVLRFERIEDLHDAAALTRLAGPVIAVERLPMATVGFSGSSHERFELKLESGDRLPLVLKRTSLQRDWVAARSGDLLGREAALLAEPALDGVWEVFACPYVGYAAEPGEIGVLMHDLTEFLMPDVRAPLQPEQEEALLGRITALHVRFWEAGVLELPWLARPELYGTTISRRLLEAPAEQRPAHMFDRVRQGWELALARSPRPVAELLAAAPEPLVARLPGLPRTLLHGDVKVANFAAIPGGRIAAFDWAIIGAGPPTIELGWYLAVNATRLTGSKQAFVERYRERLEARLGLARDERLWRRLWEVAVLAGAYMLLWSKAHAVAAGTPGADAEWSWWAEELERLT
jgi:antitoxin (DNA-binding transcriptional repressor) of toxin-antitoxin stability system